MGTRGFVWAYYYDDVGGIWALKVDADYALMPERGWSSPVATTTPPFPRGWRPRYVVGLDSEGHPRRAIVASVTATLWSRSVGFFSFYASDETLWSATVVRLVQESRAQSPR